MAHYDLTDGNVRLTSHDIAEKIYERLSEKELILVSSSKTDKGVKLECNNVIPYVPGLYLIYKKDAFNQLDCLYAGSGILHNRVYRHEKERHDKSRDDETHSAAKKFRRYAKIDSETPVYVKFMTQNERDNIVVDMLCKHYRLKNIDEHIAHIAGARFNKRVKKA